MSLFASSGTTPVVASGPTDFFRPPSDRGFNLTVAGTFVSVTIERKIDGVNWYPMTSFGEPMLYTKAFSEIFQEPETQLPWRLNFQLTNGQSANWWATSRIDGRPI